jgi:hypothetical protein
LEKLVFNQLSGHMWLWPVHHKLNDRPAGFVRGQYGLQEDDGT